MRVSMASRSGGGVSRLLMSRMPSSDRCSVRGIGVAVSVSTSTVCRSRLSRSLCSTPKRCSSSMITRPRSLKCTSALTSRCVPMMMSTPPCGQPLEDALLLAGRAEAAEALDDERILGQALAEGAEVLLGQHGRRHQHGHLLAVVDGLEGGPDGQLGLAVADVAADQAVHRPARAACRA